MMRNNVLQTLWCSMYVYVLTSNRSRLILSGFGARCWIANSRRGCMKAGCPSVMSEPQSESLYDSSQVMAMACAPRAREVWYAWMRWWGARDRTSHELFGAGSLPLKLAEETDPSRDVSDSIVNRTTGKSDTGPSALQQRPNEVSASERPPRGARGVRRSKGRMPAVF